MDAHIRIAELLNELQKEGIDRITLKAALAVNLAAICSSESEPWQACHDALNICMSILSKKASGGIF